MFIHLVICEFTSAANMKRECASHVAAIMSSYCFHNAKRGLITERARLLCDVVRFK